MLLYFKSETTRSDKEQLDLNPACRLLQTVFFVSGVLTEIYICPQYVVWKYQGRFQSIGATGPFIRSLMMFMHFT